MCPNSPRLYQQSHEGIGRQGCAMFSGLPQKLDHGPHSTEPEHWNSSHQRGVCQGGPNRVGKMTIQTSAEHDEGAGTE